MPLFSLLSLLVFISTFMHCDVKANTTIPVEVAVFEEHYQLIKKVYESYKCSDDALKLSPKNQMIVEFFILCQALKIGNANFQLVPIPYPIHHRIFQHLYDGKVEISGMGMWLSEAEENKVLTSAPVIKSGEFSKGIYHKKDNPIVIHKNKSPQFLGIRAVINTNWVMDYHALQCAGFDITHTDKYISMFKMLALDRIDVVPHAFSAHPKMHLIKERQILIPVKGYKIVFDDSLHYFISKEYALAKELHEAINIGLDKLRKTGSLEKTYRRIGVFRPETKDWANINCT